MDPLIFHEMPSMKAPVMVLGFAGWMDGGRVSTGSIEELVRLSEANKFAEIDPYDFYVFNFPATGLPLTATTEGDNTVVRAMTAMEQASIFRPQTEIRKGIVRRLDGPEADFYYSQDPHLVLFSGDEPHIRWRTYAEMIFKVVQQLNVSAIYTIGSVTGPVPHTREPRVRSIYSNAEVRYNAYHPQVSPSDYKGPASFTTLLLEMARELNIPMQTLVVDVPHYPFLEIPAYPASIVKAMNVLCELLGWEISFTEMTAAAAHINSELNLLMDRNEDFKHLVSELEAHYDLEQTADDEQILRRLIDNIDLGSEEPGI